MKKVAFVSGFPVKGIDLNQAATAVKNDPYYGPDGRLIESCLSQFPENKDLNIVAMKICLIDFTNSTNLSKSKKKVSLEVLAELIISTKDFDQRVAQGDRSLVSDLSLKTKEKGVNLFCFISKYCCYHNSCVYHKDDYSIYDGVLEKFLVQYSKNATSKVLRQLKDRSDYESYAAIIDDMLRYYNIKDPKARRKFDYFVWYFNKDKLKKPHKSKRHP
jgi:hypothetical protein